MVAEAAAKRGLTDNQGGAQKKKGGVVSKRWTPEQDEALKKAVSELGHRNWMAVAERVPGRDNAQCLQRWNKVLKPGLVKGPWSVEEDALLMEMMLKGYDNWRQVSNNIPGRTAKQCRERWRNRLDPSINKSPFTEEEDEAIQQAYEKMGNRWTQIAELLPGRTEDAVKLRWKTLNPNQKTYKKLGRPRLLPTDDSPPVSTSPVKPKMQYIGGGNQSNYVTELQNGSAALSSSVSSTVSSTASNISSNSSSVHSSYFNGPMATTSVALPEPIVDSFAGEEDERMSTEDVMILNEFLRGHSNNSLGNASSFKRMLSASSVGNLGDDIDAAILRMEAKTTEVGASADEVKVSKPSASAARNKFHTMLSLGSMKSLSLRDISEDVQPDDAFINRELTRGFSSISVDDGPLQQEGIDNPAKLSSFDSFELKEQLDSLTDAGSIMNPPLNTAEDNQADREVAAAAYAAINSNGPAGSLSGPQIEVGLQELVCEDEIPVHGFSTSQAVPTSNQMTTMTAQDFYSDTVPHDQLNHAHRFEI